VDEGTGADHWSERPEHLGGGGGGQRQDGRPGGTDHGDDHGPGAAGGH
jgi:hypothetical protein